MNCALENNPDVPYWSGLGRSQCLMRAETVQTSSFISKDSDSDKVGQGDEDNGDKADEQGEPGQLVYAWK